MLAQLACDITVRPADAPHFTQVAGDLLAVRREPGALVADYAATAAPILARLVEAERLCCAEIGWHLERVPDDRDTADAADASSGRAPSVRLRIEGSPAQLDAAALLIDPGA